MKKTFQTSKNNITEVIYNKKTKKVTFKKWWLKKNSKTTYENYTIYNSYSDELEDFKYCTLRDIEIVSRHCMQAYSKYPYPTKHISKFNFYQPI